MSLCGRLRMVTHPTLGDRAVFATGPLPATGRGTRHLVNNVKLLLLVLIRPLALALCLDLDT